MEGGRGVFSEESIEIARLERVEWDGMIERHRQWTVLTEGKQVPQRLGVLGPWVNRQRKKMRANKLSAEEVAQVRACVAVLIAPGQGSRDQVGEVAKPPSEIDVIKLQSYLPCSGCRNCRTARSRRLGCNA